MKEKNIIFVCTGNVFRSFTAERCARDFLEKNNIEGINVSSAGTVAHIQQIRQVTIKTLTQLGIDVLHHEQTQLTQGIVDMNDVIIAMNKEHQEFIAEHFHRHAPLYNELAIGKKIGIKDNWEQKTYPIDTYIELVVHHIHETMPSLIRRIQDIN